MANLNSVVVLAVSTSLSLIAACASFTSTPSDQSVDDAGSDSSLPPVTGVPAGVPGAPLGVAAAAVAVVSAVTTLAGGSMGSADGVGDAAQFNEPSGVTVDAAGSVYVADLVGNRIRKVTPAGVVTTLAGSGTGAFADGTGAGASFNNPAGVAVDVAGNVFVADSSNQRIRKVTAAGVVTTVAGSGAGYVDGPGVGAQFRLPLAIALDPAQNLYVADTYNHRIRRVTVGGAVTTIAGSGDIAFADGAGAAAGFHYPFGVTVSAAGNVFVADYDNNRIRKLTPAGTVTTVAGSGTATFADGTGGQASFDGPRGITVDVAGNLYVAEAGDHRIRRVTPGGVVTTLAGSGAPAFGNGTGAGASFNTPRGIAVNAGGELYVADAFNHRIRKIVSVGLGELAVTWGAPSVTGGSAITGYTASAGALGQTTRTCTSTGPTSCTIRGLESGVAYRVLVTATNAVGSSAPAGLIGAYPN